MITPEKAREQSNQSYLTTLKQALNLTDLRTLGIERKGFIKHALSWAIEKHTQQEKKDELLGLYREKNRLVDDYLHNTIQYRHYQFMIKCKNEEISILEEELK